MGTAKGSGRLRLPSQCFFADRLWACLTICATLGGCTSLGPTTIVADRFDYSAAIADSWKQQTLLNIVKLRYMDLPVFVDVASVVSGYSLQTGVTLNGTVSTERAVQGNFLGAAVQGVYTDRPTITYTPTTGQNFVHGLMEPIDPKNIFFMLQSGYAADLLLGMAVESLNGVRNRSTAAGLMREADPEFLRAIALMREVQAAGAFTMRVEEDKVKGPTAVILLRHDGIPSDVLDKMTEIRRLLRMPPTPQRFTLVYSPVHGADDELTVNSRSMLQIMGAFSSYMDVPEEHLRDHSALPAVAQSNGEAPGPMLHIYSGRDRPGDAYVSVRYRGYWFWIEQGDLRTKRALNAVMLFFTLANTGSKEPLPLITIPAQ
ncbi:conserved hypothetical protein [Paraburkholderia phymatum STM815]|uniref:Lipoprotein n=1 Tax=Paraburkholderia phymatum (strain DSM 17167 / CIP 108236 / LMG 21445 / STM815) TaxID=391038 RepID=B2JFU5_PARP8|nr:conserved hypothetical protein [Paraburkholderia phymatum STM815]